MSTGEIAVLGLSVDSSQVKTATSALGELTNAADKAESATGQLSATHQRLSRDAREAGDSVKSAVQDLISGVPATTELTNQLGRLAITAIGPGGLQGAFGELGAAVKAFATPTTLAVTAVAGLAVGAVLAVKSWSDYALALDDTAKQMGTTTQAAAKLQAAANFKGITDADFQKGTGQFSQNVALASHGMGDLATLFKANGVQASGFEQSLSAIADLVQKANGNWAEQVRILQQAGLPATQEWIRLLESGAAGLQQATNEAANFGGVANDQMVAKARQFDDEWNKAWANFKQDGRSAVADVSGFISTLGFGINAAILSFDKATSSGGGVPSFAKTVFENSAARGAGAQLTSQDANAFYGSFGQTFSAQTAVGGGVKDVAVQRAQIEAATPRLGLLGQLAPVPKRTQNQPPRKVSEDDSRCDRRAA